MHGESCPHDGTTRLVFWRYSNLHHGRNEILNYPNEYAPKSAKVAELVAEAACDRRKNVAMINPIRILTESKKNPYIMLLES